MVFALLSFFVGFALLLLVFFVWINNQKDKKLNIYFLVILAVAGMQRFLQGVEAFGLIASFKNPFVGNFTYQFFMFVVVYLFFHNLVFKTTPVKKVILHFVFPILFALTNILYNLPIELIQIVFFLFSSLYVALPAALIGKYVYKRKNYKELLHFQSIKTWATFVFSIYSIIYILSNYLFITGHQEDINGFFVQFYNVSSLVWLVIVFYILKNPVILYGEQLLLKNLNSISGEEVVVWRKSKLEPTAQDDLELENKVASNVDKLIFEIKKFEVGLLEKFEKPPTLKELAFRLNYPQSHLKYVFKYHTYCSYSEYQSILKIKYALILIKSGYLDTHTIDSLASVCLFSHRSSFYFSFKKWTGYTPLEYQSSTSSSKE
jgi:AraC-like DNA-binding protein